MYVLALHTGATLKTHADQVVSKLSRVGKRAPPRKHMLYHVVVLCCGVPPWRVRTLPQLSAAFAKARTHAWSCCRAQWLYSKLQVQCGMAVPSLFP